MFLRVCFAIAFALALMVPAVAGSDPRVQIENASYRCKVAATSNLLSKAQTSTAKAKAAYELAWQQLYKVCFVGRLLALRDQRQIPHAYPIAWEVSRHH